MVGDAGTGFVAPPQRHPNDLLRRSSVPTEPTLFDAAPAVNTKRCNRCGLSKPTTEFIRNARMKDGLLNQCKACRQLAQSKRERIRTPETRAAERQYLRDYRRRNPEAKRLNNLRYQQRYPDKARAHRLLNEAVLRGEVERKPCEVCGSTNAQGHHDDYSKPLEVRWLCPVHHAAEHPRAQQKPH
jgi:hypothetical protein